MRDGVLDDEGFDAFGMGEDHAEADGAAVVLHVERVVREAERFGEMIHHVGDVVEGVVEFFRVGPIAMAEAGVIGGDHVVAIGKAGEERLEHSRGRGESVEKEKRGGVFGAGFAVEDGEVVYFYCAVCG